MSQDLINTPISPESTSGTDLANLIGAMQSSMLSGLIGTSRPAQLVKGGNWIKDDTNNWIFYFYNGTIDIEIFRVAKATNAVTMNVTAQTSKSGVIGELTMWGASTPPSNFLICDGSEISRTIYADLFAIVGNTFGNGDGVTTFDIPDFRGKFARGYDTSGQLDQQPRSLGSYQIDALQGHSHGIPSESQGNSNGFSTTKVKRAGSGGDQYTISTNTSSNAPETTVKNLAIHYIIRYALDEI